MENLKRTHNHLDADGKIAVILFLDKFMEGDKLQRGAVKKACLEFSISKDTVARIWELRGKLDLKNPASIRVALGNRKKGRVGPKKSNVDQEKVKSIPYEQRETIRSLAAAMGMAPTTVHRHIGYGSFSWSPSVIKPVLSEAHNFG